MSRLNALSAAAKRAMFSSETDQQLIMLVTIQYRDINGLTQYFRIADSFTQRVVDTNEEVQYGVISRNLTYYFMPVQITLPDETEGNTPRCSLAINDVTHYLTPAIRELTDPPLVTIELVLASQPDTVEASFSSLYITNITYNADTVQCQLEMVNFSLEPFPAYTFSPNYFPGLF